MESTGHSTMERAALRVQANRDELVERLSLAIPSDGAAEPLKGVRLYRAASPTELHHSVFEPAFCLIAQGAKEICVGDQVYRYDPYHYLLATVELPVVSQVVEASAARPYLSLRLMLDSALVSSVMVEAASSEPESRSSVSAFDVCPLDGGLLDAVVRLVRLLASPAEAPVLGPLIMREIVFRLLMGAQGGRLRHLAVLGGHSHRIAGAVKRLHREFDQPLRIDHLAQELGMSVSGFHHHFKAVTGMSPLQFQKQLRLQEARRLLVSADVDAASVGFQVGYNDASHFSREYKRHFGEPPMRDVERIRETNLERSR